MSQDLRNLIKKHEGLRLKPYLCTEGKLTIGYGRNLDATGIVGKEAEIILSEGISEQAAEFLLENDIVKAHGELKLNIPYWDELSEVRRAVLVDMCFNLGLRGLLKFKRMFLALKEDRYKDAAKEMLDSTWATQVKGRANELAFMMREDKYQST
ncbi:MAG: glycoside hydrolase family protein [Candidatus Sabulitectum sp.]|nr:glycoside hydrolase family protein [Candidatus Sabulitectum sp.]